MVRFPQDRNFAKYDLLRQFSITKLKENKLPQPKLPTNALQCIAKHSKCTEINCVVSLLKMQFSVL